MIAARVANAIADSYLRDLFETRIREAGRLTSSMERQLIDLKLKMESTHNALMVYQRDLGTADPEQKTSVLVAKLQALNGAAQINSSVFYIDWKDVQFNFALRCGFAFLARVRRSSWPYGCSRAICVPEHPERRLPKARPSLRPSQRPWSSCSWISSSVISHSPS